MQPPRRTDRRDSHGGEDRDQAGIGVERVDPVEGDAGRLGLLARPMSTS
jgi:hypothetical protein